MSLIVLHDGWQSSMLTTSSDVSDVIAAVLPSPVLSPAGFSGPAASVSDSLFLEFVHHAVRTFVFCVYQGTYC
jgi:hypothetical protein